jgi:hypothetical protein
MDAVRELAQLGDRLTELCLGFVEARHELAILVGSELRAEEAQREREPDETLLGAVVEVALEPAALGITGLDDADTRGAEIGQLGARLGLEALVFEREARRRRDFLDELGVVEEAGSVQGQGDWPAFPHEGRCDTTVQ